MLRTIFSDTFSCAGQRAIFSSASNSTFVNIRPTVSSGFVIDTIPTSGVALDGTDSCTTSVDICQAVQGSVVAVTHEKKDELHDAAAVLVPTATAVAEVVFAETSLFA